MKVREDVDYKHTYTSTGDLICLFNDNEVKMLKNKYGSAESG